MTGQERRDTSVLITDVDDTLFDWFQLWRSTFSAMLEEVLKISGADRGQVLDEFREVHQTHGTSEYAFSLQELPSLQRYGTPAQILENFRPAIDAFRTARRENLQLFSGVLETLIEWRRRGGLLVAYTESLSYYTKYRLQRLGLDGVIDYLFSPPDHEIPPDLIRRYSAPVYEFRHTVHLHTPKGEHKPNPHLLLQILKDVGGHVGSAAYIGDKLDRDVQMAKDAGVLDVHARYGVAHEREEYDLLVAVSHWTQEMIDREKATKREDVEPTIEVQSFDRILEHLRPVRFQGGIRRE